MGSTVAVSRQYADCFIFVCWELCEDEKHAGCEILQGFDLIV